ncbi:MAG: SDR family NAD(P)-dependent oxidoreductase [Deltaproteobacteria bacterium]|nr:SDR family NAD(P)-dependent oxidoreductase [Deltaproteobacteria bacterium]MCB9478743.1 SDR family NAD(P)-dependent oxidoreductase [Deltaproteobacteria bacterium]MCB9488259.1 SDR family NAD(P)-dependent oxidoreductase [Deltaproteobacteria bacterium]
MSDREIVLITGCSSGIGRALALEFASRGMHVVATARRLESMQELADKGMTTRALDINDQENVEQVVGAIIEEFGHIDYLVNNAGINLVGPSVEIPIDQIRKQMETNVIAQIAVTQAVAPFMMRRRKGRIVNITSVMAVMTVPFSGPYCAAKAAFASFTDALRMELAPFGVQVIAVPAGAVRSSISANAEQSRSEYTRADSFYAAAEEGIHKRVHASQQHPLPTEDFARILVERSTRPHPPRYIRIGNGATRWALFKRAIPSAILDRVLSRIFQLDRVRP